MKGAEIKIMSKIEITIKKYHSFLVIFFIKKFGSRALIITARDMNRNERKHYAKK